MKWQFSGILFVLLFSFQLSKAQPASAVKWAVDGNSYYTTEAGEIVQYQLPSFQKKVIVAKSNLVPKGAKQGLTLRNYAFNADASLLLIYTNTKKVWRYDTKGDYWILNLVNNELNKLGKGLPESSLMFAKFSPDGKKVAYVSEHNIYAEDVATHVITQLTKDGSSRLINGTFDWVYEEEFDCRDGFRWSPDSKSIAYWQLDATKIRNFSMINNTDSIYSRVIPVEYPKVGEDPSACKIGVVNIKSAKTTWMNVPGNSKQHYIPRMEWSGVNELILQQLTRRQNESRLFTVNATTGAANVIYTEVAKAWIDIESSWTTPVNSAYGIGWRWLKNQSQFLWLSEKDGWRHIYLLNKDGKKETLLTPGDYDVITIAGYNEESNLVYFMASPNNPTQQYLYQVALDGTGKAERISPSDMAGTHRYTISPNGKYAQHRFSSHKQPPFAEWVSLPNNQQIKALGTKPPIDENAPISFIKVTTQEGVTLDGWMIKPNNFDSTKKYPVVFYVYTEPGASTVSDEYGAAGNFLYNGDMMADGYIQISIEGRGTPVPKGAAWRKAIYKQVGILNVSDQAEAAKVIRTWPFVDSNRVAVWGWSGGGSTTLNLMFQYPNIYQTGIAIAPVANRLTYDNIYEERYMGLPQDGDDHYKKASAITHAKGLKGNLLLVHGTGDDNVHYQNTEMLVNELIKYQKQFQIMVYPNRTHSINEGAGTSRHLSELYTRFLKQHCPGGAK